MRLIATGPPKYCAECGHCRPRSDFYAHRGPNGVVYALPLCVEHHKARVIARQKANHRRTLATLKRFREKRKQDPERLAIRRDQAREHARRKLGITPDRYRTERVAPTLAGSYDVGPFAAWLRTLGDTSPQIAAVTGLNDRQVRRYLSSPRGRVSPGVVDRACRTADCPAEELYPTQLAA
jgi:hypothetical protein